ncbi:unnamed protein product [Ambrosiozyma monospora]|uniref:Unnamed protein product n=1 Tax=Ambrosiozyma monospora TaxID=43982 RepID=A0A9W7DGH7_AMBMO|nr:unnamed protein product [Ambrosiozyma monospora]
MASESANKVFCYSSIGYNRMLQPTSDGQGQNRNCKNPNKNPFKTNKFYIDQVRIIDLPLLKSIAVATISQIKRCNYCRTVGHAVTECPDTMACSKCKQKGHHHLHCKSKFTYLSPEENEAVVIANAINNLNQVIEAILKTSCV